jgi:hypothetical protein
MGTRISCKDGWLYVVDESVAEVQAILDSGAQHTFLPWAAYKSGHEVDDPDPVVLSRLVVTMLASTEA